MVSVSRLAVLTAVALLAACAEHPAKEQYLHLKIDDQPETLVPITQKAKDGEPCSFSDKPIDRWALDVDGNVLFCSGKP